MSQSIQLRVLDRRELSGFTPYLLPETRHLLAHGDDRVVSLGAVQGIHSCGAAAALAEGGTARLTDLFVDETVRRQGIGAELLDKLISALRERGVTQLAADYVVSEQDFAAAEALFRFRGFSEPVSIATNYSTHSRFFRESGILSRAFRANHRTPENIVSFAELSSAALEQLMEEDIPYPLSWACNRSRAIPELSAALLVEGEVAAYLLCGESADGGCLLLSTIARSDAPSNAFLSLLWEVLNRFFYRYGGDFPVYFSATTEYINHMVLRLMEGHFTAYTEYRSTRML